MFFGFKSILFCSKRKRKFIQKHSKTFWSKTDCLLDINLYFGLDQISILGTNQYHFGIHFQSRTIDSKHGNVFFIDSDIRLQLSFFHLPTIIVFLEFKQRTVVHFLLLLFYWNVVAIRIFGPPHSLGYQGSVSQCFGEDLLIGTFLWILIWSLPTIHKGAQVYLE